MDAAMLFLNDQPTCPSGDHLAGISPKRVSLQVIPPKLQAFSKGFTINL
jgi:hypothetical protein